MVTGSLLGAGWLATRGELVTEVIDGDSIKLANKQTIRLASLDAPALGNCMGQEAKTALTKLVLGKRVVLTSPETDHYGRILALVWVHGRLVNEYLIRYGFAVSLREYVEGTQNIKAANDYARSHHLGVYSPDCYQPNPPNPRCPIKGNITDGTKEKRYFTPDCRQYSKVIVERNMGEQYFCTELEAQKAGYIKSCDPRL